MRFYPGTTAMGWLDETPIAVIRACLAMLPRLEAREALQSTNRQIVASGRLKPHDAKRQVRQWERAAAGDVGQPAGARRKPNEIGLAAMGIGVRKVEKPRGR